MTTQNLADILVKCGVVHAGASLHPESDPQLVGRIAEAAVMVSAMEADLVSALMRPGRCANCGNLKPLPYRRDDLGGYVCLTCVENHLNAKVEECRQLNETLAKFDLEENSRFMMERDEWQKHAEQSDKELCELQDALGCPAELRLVECARCDWKGTTRDATLPGECPKPDCTGRLVDGGVVDAQVAAMERIRDLIAMEAQLAAIREAIPFPTLTAGNAHAMAWHVSQGKAFAGLEQSALEEWLRSIEACLDKLSLALSTESHDPAQPPR